MHNIITLLEERELKKDSLKSIQIYYPFLITS